jgi:superfamily II DNA or RNA helicase
LLQPPREIANVWIYLMGYITEKLADEIGPLTQQRGRQYFSHGAVRRIEGNDSYVSAVVQGSALYNVTLSWADSLIEYSCTCPYFERDFNLCKHIWAVCLKAEQERYLGAAADFTPPRPAAQWVPGESIALPARLQAVPSPPKWRKQLQPLFAAMKAEEEHVHGTAPRDREFFYVVDAYDTHDRGQLSIEIAQRQRRLNGTWGKLKSKKVGVHEINRLGDPVERRILALLLGSPREIAYGYSQYYGDSARAQFVVPEPLWDVVLPLMCGTGRCVLRQSIAGDVQQPLCWDDGQPWDFGLKVAAAEYGGDYVVTGVLRRGDSVLGVQQPLLLVPGGLVVYQNRVSRLDDHGAFRWISLLRDQGPLSIPRGESDEFLAELLRLGRRPTLDLPAPLQFREIDPAPKPALMVQTGERTIWGQTRLRAKLSFDYEGQTVPYAGGASAIFEPVRRVLLRRNHDLERAAVKRLAQLGLRRDHWINDNEFQLLPELLPRAVRALTAEGWRIEAEGKIFRTAGALRVEISSGVDWFELGGTAEFGDAAVPLPRLLRAVKQGEQTVRLDDGSVGIIPEEWLNRYGLLAELANADKGRLRFKRTQAALLDALLAAAPDVRSDQAFERVRDELRSFSGVAPADAPHEFAGRLRDYQRQGLGWLFFLQRFGFGGCLADDMGLGKTIQVLALLASRRERRAGKAADRIRPSVVVVPRSLVFHWKNEAARFAPKLKVLDHTTTARLKPGDHFRDYDLVITTYGVLTRDVLQFKDQRFDYCILDEAQAIKNAGTLSAKAARLIEADHRLALSGTPVENHLGELWSLFEFLNAGMLGRASLFGAAGRNPDEATRKLLAEALRPFILRRTKGEVARELPPKTEQTIYCDLEAKERKLYDELRAYYRAELISNGPRDASGRFKIQVLEALLRLRQAACHPGLIDKSKVDESSAKIDTLLAQLDQVLEEGHKALVFSQFTSLLSIVRSRLDRTGVRYGYLDGRTRDRQARVEEFQNDPDLKLFLISLKAGGLGLNLHAAEYVYLLDPWWNPAVEAQAIDRAHRIGQTRQVFAYRLITRDTVEEKVLQLQKSKRDLADAIITANNSLIQNLTREDLELLLS